LNDTTIERALTRSFGLCLLSLVLMAALPVPAQAKDGPPGPDGLPVAHSKHPWNTFMGTPRVDTLSFTPSDVLPVARRQIENDQWEVFAADQGTIVTRWKAMHHPLLLLFVGHVNARCTVTLEPLGNDRTRMVFRADLASHGNLEESPFLGRAKSAYAKAANNYFANVRYSLSTRSVPRPRAATSRRLAPLTGP